MELFQKAETLNAEYCLTFYEKACLYFKIKDYENCLLELNKFSALSARKIDPTEEANILLNKTNEIVGRTFFRRNSYISVSKSV